MTDKSKITPTDWQAAYRTKLIGVDEAAALVESNDTIWSCGLSSQPIAFLQALARRKSELCNVEVYGGIVLQPFDILTGEYRGHINYCSFFNGPIEKSLYGQGNIKPMSAHLSEIDDATRYSIQPNVMAVHVSAPDADGYMSFGPCGGVGNWGASEVAEKIIVTVNSKLPHVPGDFNMIHVTKVSHIIEDDSDIPLLPSAEASATDRAVAAQIVPYIDDGDTIQIGIGGITNALAYSLKNKKDLGVHTEMLTDSIVYLSQQGVVTGARKNINPGKINFSFAAGGEMLMAFCDNNEQLEAEPMHLAVNSNLVAKNNNFISINTCLLVDLTGQVAAEGVGYQQISATGGQLDLVRAARLSKGGKSFIALASTRGQGADAVSNICLGLPIGTPVTTPRSDVEYIATEYGVVRLRHLAIEDRAKAMISIAHPDFREQLTSEAIAAGVIRA
ncbi:acyl-CoA hydrolase [Sinobacterium caligoides]|uniref:Acyl-CoA hydrolase n=1 Tax=Sinobacterium caligoides TaxID=933926 RepID=A0A3N2E118_9GAMM|nr:acetyl-CoA hydrolase/transferase C-terminal domain-containing protein [Sinobacterium caligoides]ROS05813.1 acyl-CoA hydrolase [Sinobacterium caligoides]